MRIPAAPTAKLISTLVLLLGLAFCPRASAQFNPIQAAKDAYNKAKQQQQQQKPQQGQQQAQQPNQQQAGTPDNSASQSQQQAPNASQPSPAAPQAPASGSALGGVQLPPAPPGGLDPSKLPDIVGIHIGTPTDKVIAQLNSLYPLVRNERGTQMFGPGGGNGDGRGVAYVKYAPTNDPPFISSALFTRPFLEGCINPKVGSCQVQDEIRSIFSGPPQKLLVRLERTLSWQQQTTSDNLKAALIQKYGPNFTESPRLTLNWAFDEEGKALPAPKPNVFCGTLLSQQGYPGPNFQSISNYIGSASEPVTQQQLTSFMRGRCPYIHVQAQINGLVDGTATQMTVVIEELPQDLRNAFAADQYMRQAANAQANQQLKKSQQQTVPKF